MSHDVFISILSQIYNCKKANVVVQGNVIFIETTKNKNSLKIKTKISKNIKNTSSYIPSNGILHIQDRGSYLKLDNSTNDVYLISEIKFSDKYIPFKYQMKDFIDVATEWKEILEDFSCRTDDLTSL